MDLEWSPCERSSVPTFRRSGDSRHIGFRAAHVCSIEHDPSVIRRRRVVRAIGRFRDGLRWSALVSAGVLLVLIAIVGCLSVPLILLRRFGVDSPEFWSGTLVTSVGVAPALLQMRGVRQTWSGWKADERRLRNKVLKPDADESSA